MKTCLLYILLLTACTSFAGDGQPVKDYYKPASEKTLHVSATKYDYTEVAAQITSGCQDDYQRIRAIYEWICQNISYDPSYKIHTADKCFDERKGVCQGYCELFYQIATAAGLKVEIVNGNARDHNGVFDRLGHAWIFAYTRPDHGILLDPTWGAGFLEGNEFKRSGDCWLWFNVPPEWMILSHLPDDEQYQLIDKPMTLKEFKKLMPVTELWVAYGLDPHDLYRQVREGTLRLPRFYHRGEGELQLLDFPRCTSLRIGQRYTFRVRLNTSRQLALVNNKVQCPGSEWTSEGDGVYAVSFMPRDTKTVSIALRDRQQENRWNVLVQYDVEPPTDQDWELVARDYPLSLPEVQTVDNLDESYAEGWATAGIDGHQLLRIIREQHIRELPIIYHDRGQQPRIASVPMTYRLRAGQSYTFSFYPPDGCRWALVLNDRTWCQDWLLADDGMLSQAVTPTSPGPLQLYVQLPGRTNYVTCLEYRVE